jgi:hypothetical protein
MDIGFRQFIESKEEEDVKQFLTKLPKGHQELVKGFSVKFQGGNTLKGDSGHVGIIDFQKNTINIAAPFRYSRCHCLGHEIAHLIYEKLMTPELKKEWLALVKKTPDRDKQDAEELFAHAYACHYLSSHCPKIHDHPEWHEFIQKRVPTE